MNKKEAAHPRIIVLSGEEFQRLERLNEIIAGTVDSATRDFNLDVFWPDEFPFERFSDVIDTFPMMAERRVAIIRNFDNLHRETQKKVAKRLSSIPESTLVVIEGESAEISGLPRGWSVSETFKQVYSNNLPSWIRNRFTKRGKRVEENAINLMMNNVGDVLGELDNEIEKAVIVAASREMVTEDDVKMVVGEFKRDTIWELCNVVGQGEFADAVKILRNLMETEKNKETSYVSALFTHVMKLSEYNSLRKKGIPHTEAMKAVVQHSYFWKNGRYDAQVKNFNQRSVQRALNTLSRTESRLKSSRMDSQLLMELAIPFIMPRKSDSR